MNFLAFSQLLLGADEIIGKACHANFSGDAIKAFRKALEEAINFCKQTHDNQLEAQKKIEEQQKLENENKSNEVQ